MLAKNILKIKEFKPPGVDGIQAKLLKEMLERISRGD